MVKFNIDFVVGPYIHIEEIGEVNEYTVRFIDADINEIVYETTIKSNSWAKASRIWYTLWRIVVIDKNDNTVFDYTLDLSKYTVRVNILSKALGDTISWVPYIEEFRKKHNCKVVCSTHQNNLFRNIYKNIVFVNPEEETPHTKVVYNITYFDDDELPGWVWKCQHNKTNPYKIPLQKVITDILGLKYREIRPSIYIDKKTKKNRYMKEKYVCISEKSTSKAKLWNNENGWQELVDYLNSVGYKVVVISREKTNLKGIINRTGKVYLGQRIKQLYHCEFFIGVGSGLGWLAWAIGKKVVMISGFSKPFTEFVSDNIRIYNPNVCTGCFNRFKFIKEDWEWCPVHKDTDRHFECTKSITSEMVISKIEKEIYGNNI